MIRHYFKIILSVCVLCAAALGTSCNNASNGDVATGFSVTSATNPAAAAAATAFDITFDMPSNGTQYKADSTAAVAGTNIHTAYAIIYQNGTSVGVAGTGYDAIGKKVITFRITYTATSVTSISSVPYTASVSMGNLYYSGSGTGSLSTNTAVVSGYTIHTINTISPSSFSVGGKTLAITSFSAVQEW